MRALSVAVLLTILASAAQSEQIRRACMGSDRASSAQLCHCIQSAADRTLSRKDQKLAASFFKDPDRAQEIRMSDRQSHERFWERYKAFGEFASALCS